MNIYIFIVCSQLEQAKAQASKDNKDTAPGNPSVPVTPVEGKLVVVGPKAPFCIII